MITDHHLVRVRNIVSIIAKDIKNVFNHNLAAMLLLALITAIVCIFVFAYSKKITKGKGRYAFPFYALSLTVFVPYVYAMLQIAVFSRGAGSRAAIALDLTPFATWGRTAVTNAYVLENILFFVPLGILLPIVTYRKFTFLNCVLCGALFSLGIETLQLQTGRGYFQLDDILMNTLGTVLGALIYYLSRAVLKLFIHNPIPAKPASNIL